MPHQDKPRHQHDYALLEQRYIKLLRISALPREQWNEAIGALLDEAERENDLPESGSAAKDDAPNVAISDLTGRTSARLFRDPTTLPLFPKRTPKD